MSSVCWATDHVTLRFNQHIGPLSQKMQTVTRKTLEADGLVARKMYPQIPPKVEYTLTNLGKSLLPAVATLTDWATTNMPIILESRARCDNQARSVG